MITHYDMSTGELIGDSDPERQAHGVSHPAAATELRLMGVHEDSTRSRRGNLVPADIVHLPVRCLLARFS
jgi:hypothetical protein